MNYIYIHVFKPVEYFNHPNPQVPPQGLPPPAQMGMVPHYDESTLIPSLPYFDLPAGLMVPLVKMEDSGYKPLDPKKIRQVI